LKRELKRREVRRREKRSWGETWRITSRRSSGGRVERVTLDIVNEFDMLMLKLLKLFKRCGRRRGFN
jgi:hypothetical protein